VITYSNNEFRGRGQNLKTETIVPRGRGQGQGFNIIGQNCTEFGKDIWLIVDA